MSETGTASDARLDGIDPTDAVPYLGLILCYTATVVGGLALTDAADRAGLVFFQNPEQVGNVGVFAVILLVGTAVMLVAFRYELGTLLLRVFMVLVFGEMVAIAWVLGTGIGEIATGNFLITGLPTSPIPIAITLGVAVGLWVYPEWYVIDVVAIVAGAAAIPMFGLGFGPLPIVVLLVVWAAYDAVAVYGLGHMKDLAEGGIGMKVPILYVIPTERGFSYLDDDEAAGERADEEVATADEEGSAQDDDPVEDAAADGEEEITEAPALMLGLGDALIPGMLAVSAAHFLPGETVIPLLGANLPAVGALLGGLVGMGALLFVVSKFEGAHAGLPPLNAGVLGGYLLGALAAGIPITTALGL